MKYEWRSSAMKATRLATRTRRLLCVDDQLRADPFDALRQLGLAVVFQPTTGMLGALVRQGSGGVIITASRDPSVQRYTAAHELGHWLLHDDHFIQDDAATIFRQSNTLREYEAQVFAGAFLAPARVMHRVVRGFGLGPRESLTPVLAYRAARNIGISYQAFLQQAANIGMIDIASQRALGQIAPVDIKAEILGRRPTNSRNDVWEAPADGSVLEVAVGDDVILDATANIHPNPLYQLERDRDTVRLNMLHPGEFFWHEPCSDGGAAQLQCRVLLPPAGRNEELIVAAFLR